MVAMTAKVLSPQKANDTKDLEATLDHEFELTKSALLKIIPRDDAKVMREQFEKHDTYDCLEQ